MHDTNIEDKDNQYSVYYPSYYNEGKISPFDYINKNRLNFYEGNVIKYITRHKDKNKIEDVIKAKNYIDYIIKNYENIY